MSIDIKSFIKGLSSTSAFGRRPYVSPYQNRPAAFIVTARSEAMLIPVPPSNVVAPSITATNGLTVGETLIASDGIWLGAPSPTFTRQWYRGASPIAGATGRTYILVDDDAGFSLFVETIATNSQNTASSRSIATGPIQARPVEPVLTIPGIMDAPTLTAGNNRLTVARAEEPDDGGSPITGYQFRYTTNGSTYVVVDMTTASQPLTGLVNDTAVSVQTRAVNAIGPGPWSTARSATPIPALPSITPTSATFQIGLAAGEIILAWPAKVTGEDRVFISSDNRIAISNSGDLVAGLAEIEAGNLSNILRQSRGDETIDTPVSLIAYAPLAIAGVAGPAWVGEPYSFAPQTTGGLGAKSFSRGGPALPAGLSFSTETGFITGTPTSSGTVTGVSITVTDETGSKTLPTFSIDVTVPMSRPTLPLATGARVAAIGDSQIGYNNTFGGAVSTASAAAYSTGYGFIEQASAHDQRFRFDNWFDTADPRGFNYVGANQGIHGDHLEWTQAGYGGGILGRLPALLARRPDIVIIEGGINTIATGDDGAPGTTDYVTGKLDAALRQARRAGVWAILMTIYPRGDWVNASDPKMAIVDAVNAWIRAQAGRDGVLGILDAESLLRPGGVFDATMFKADLIHLSPKGALAVGRSKLLPILQAAISAGSTFDKDPTVSNLIIAGRENLTGTTGTQTGWPKNDSTPVQTFSGQLATGFTVSRGRNVSMVASKEVISGSLEQQVLAITPGGSESGAYFDFTISGFNALETHTPGQWYQAYLEVELLGDGLTFLSMAGGHRTTGGAVVTNANVLLREASGDYALGVAGGARTFWLQTEPFKLPDGAATTDRLTMSITGTGPKAAAAFTMKIRRPILRRSADPRPSWGY